MADSHDDWLRSLSPLPQPELPNLLKWVGRRERPLTVFDLEATTKSPHFSHFGIIEVGLVHVSRTAEVTVGSDLINPEHSLSRDAARITGIRREQIDGQPTWAQVWARRFHWIAATHTTAGFNSVAFDCPAVVLQNERYGVRGTQFAEHIDVACLAGIGGSTLDNAATRAGVEPPRDRHRALADAILTARILDTVILRLTDKQLFLTGHPSARRDQIVEMFKGGQPTVDDLAEQFGRARGTIEKDLLILIEDGELQPHKVANASVQRLLDPVFAEAVQAVWAGDNHGRLKPLKEWIDAKLGEDIEYFQLRLCLRSHGLSKGRGY